MDELLSGDDSHLAEFYDALMASDQRHIVHLMNFKSTVLLLY